MIFCLYEERAYSLAKAVKQADLQALDIAADGLITAWYRPGHKFTLATMAGHIEAAGGSPCGYGVNIDQQRPYIRFYARGETT